MKGFFTSNIDFDDYNELEQISETKYTKLSLFVKKSNPTKKYIIKTFKFNSNIPKHQKIIAQTFHQVNAVKKQYIKQYKQYSFFSNSQNPNPTFLIKYTSSDTLEKIMASPDFRKKWEIKDALNCLFAVAESLSYLHSHNIQHGNLCPSNIIVDKAKQCYLCDFGLYDIKKLYMKHSAMFNKDYKDPNMLNYLPTKKNDVYSYGVLISQLFLIFTAQQITLNEFITRKDPDKYKLLPKLFQKVISKCLSPEIKNSITISEIIKMYQSQTYVIEKNRISDLYQNFIKINYIETLANMNDSNALYSIGKMYDKGIMKDNNKEKSLCYYEKAANLNNSEAQNNYGLLLHDKWPKDAMKLQIGTFYLKKSADQGNVHGMTSYGIALSNGIGVYKNIREAEEYLKKAADMGFSPAQTYYGYLLIKNKIKSKPERVNKGLSYIKKAISQNYSKAYYMYGLLLSDQKQLGKNDQVAMEYFKIAADMGEVDSMMEYADRSLKGIGVPANNETAFKYYLMAKEKGNKEANKKLQSLKDQINCGYEKKQVNPKPIQKKEAENNDTDDIFIQKSPQPLKKPVRDKKNFSLFISESSSDYSDTDYMLSTKLNDSPKEIDVYQSLFTDKDHPEKLYSLFKEFKKEYDQENSCNVRSELNLFIYEDKFIETKEPKIIYKYAKLYMHLNELNDDHEKSMKYFQMAADLGYSKSQTYFGVSLIKGEGIEQDRQRGMFYLKKSADQQFPEGLFYYGYWNKDPIIHHQYIEKAVKNHYKTAEYYYGKDFMEGQGVKKDYKKASEIFIKLYNRDKNIKVLIKLIECLKQSDLNLAINYIKILADSNDEKYKLDINNSCFEYGLELFKGEKIEKNVEEAVKYLTKSNQIDQIRDKYPDIFAFMPHDFSSVKSKVDLFLSRKRYIEFEELEIIQNAYEGNIEDTFNAAKMIEKAGDYATANFFYEIAADSNHAKASFILGEYYTKGQHGLEKNEKKGIKYISRAIRLGCMLNDHSKCQNRNLNPESITILVEPEKKNLTMIEVNPVNRDCLKSIYGKYISTSMKDKQKIIFDYGNHPVLQGFVDAYKNHRPVTISPDIIWLLIVQSFSHHVNANSEKLRKKFVNFSDKKDLVVDRRDLNIFLMSPEDYETEIFPDFVKKISDYTGKRIVDILTPKFTTTTAVSLAVGQISIMSAMQNYFKYKLLLAGCGFPYVTIEGSLEDWEEIVSKLNKLKIYEFEKFSNQFIEIINKIIETKKGNVDHKFWKEMIRIKDPDGTYSPQYIDGWFSKFFPFNFYEKVIKGPIKNGEIMPSEMLKVPFILKICSPGMENNAKPISCEMLAGFVGLTQNQETASLKPEIGWLIRKQKVIPENEICNYQREQQYSNRIKF